MRPSDLSPDEYAAYFAGYIGKVPDTTLRSALDESLSELLDYLTHVPEGREDFAYAPGKWTIKQCLQHLLDTERVFAYRALRLGRGDTTPLPGFDQDDYAAAADVSGRTLPELIEELRLLRDTSVRLFRGFTDADLLRRGTMSGGSASVRGIGFIMCGHFFHHAQLYRERYG